MIYYSWTGKWHLGVSKSVGGLVPERTLCGKPVDQKPPVKRPGFEPPDSDVCVWCLRVQKADRGMMRRALVEAGELRDATP